MILFYQFDWSPYCLVIRRILEYGRIEFRAMDVPARDRSVVWRLTRERYYQVPVIKEGRQVLFETGPDSQVLAKYLDSRFGLGLFPQAWDGVQDLLWRYFENDVEGVTFRLNDAHWREFVPAADRCAYVRHKERKFGRGCLEEWRAGQGALVAQLEALLLPAEQMLGQRPFLLGEQPVFVDFCLFGMLANYLYSGHYRLPASLVRLAGWHARMSRLKKPAIA
jgi:glutathione S-transferase